MNTEDRCFMCNKIITWGEYRFSMDRFKKCKELAKGLCYQHQKDQRNVEYPKELAHLINNL